MPSFNDQIKDLPTDVLLGAYRGQRNPLNTANRVAPEGQQNVAQVLASRGIDVSNEAVTPGGQVHRGGIGSVLRSVGKVISAPVRGVSHALATSGIPLVSDVGRVGENLGNAVAGKGAFLRDIGKAGQAAAPLAGLIPGVGPLAGLAIGAGGTFLNSGAKTQLGDLAKYGGEGALSGLANAQLAGGRGILGLGAVPGNLSRLAGQAGHLATGAGGGLLKTGGGLLHAGGGAVASLIGKIAQNPLQAAELGLAGLSTVQGIRQQNRAQDLQQQALNRTQQDYQARSPLRDALLAGALQLPTTLPGSQVPQLPAYQSANPFARRGQ